MKRKAPLDFVEVPKKIWLIQIANTHMCWIEAKEDLLTEKQALAAAEDECFGARKARVLGQYQLVGKRK